MKKYFDLFASPLLIVGLAGPLLIWFPATVFGLKIPLGDAVGAISFKIYYGSLMLCSAVMVIRALGSKRFVAAVVGLGLFMTLLQGALWHGFRFKGKAGVGEGETLSSYYSVQAGSLAKPDVIPLTFIGTKPDDPRTALIGIDGKTEEVQEGKDLFWKSYRLKMSAISLAPLMVLQDPNGRELEGGYFKLSFDQADPPYVQFPSLPHRFHVSLPDMPIESWEMASGFWKKKATAVRRKTGVKDAEILQLRIMRGKLTVLNQPIHRGKPVPFGNYAIQFETGAPWIELEVEKTQSYIPFSLGLTMLAIGGVAWIQRRTPL